MLASLFALQDSVSSLLWSGSARKTTITVPDLKATNTIMIKFNVRDITCVATSSDGSYRIGGSTGEGAGFFTVYGSMTINGDEITLGDIAFSSFAVDALGKSPIFNTGDHTYVVGIYSV